MKKEVSHAPKLYSLDSRAGAGGGGGWSAERERYSLLESVQLHISKKQLTKGALVYCEVKSRVFDKIRN